MGKTPHREALSREKFGSFWGREALGMLDCQRCVVGGKEIPPREDFLRNCVCRSRLKEINFPGKIILLFSKNFQSRI